MTRASARRLWHYAIAEDEKHAVDEADLPRHGGIGLVKSTSRAAVRAMTWPSGARRARCASITRS